MAEQSYDPAQYPELIASFAVRNPKASLAWFGKLGFQTSYQMPMPDGSVAHAEVVRKGVHLMLGRAGECVPGSTGLSLYINLRDEAVDDLCARARAAGVTIDQEPHDEFWGDRIFQVSHPDGYRLIFAQHVRDVSHEEMQEAVKQWAGAQALA